MNKPTKIVLTGAESTGKSTLSKKLASYYNVPWIPEIARTYIESLNRVYTYSDIEQIAKLQIEKENEIGQNEKLIFFDTWLIITKVWFDFVYGKHPLWLNKAIEQCKIDLFLVCDIDLPWEYDPIRENGGENRRKLHNIYIKELQNYGFKYKIISGNSEERMQIAIKEINKIRSHESDYRR